MTQMYLYNGVKLPALPDIDTDTYPYMYITVSTTKGDNLYCSTTPFYKNENQFYMLIAKSDGECIVYSYNYGGDWDRNIESDFTFIAGTKFSIVGSFSGLFWMNYPWRNYVDNTLKTPPSRPSLMPTYKPEMKWETLFEGLGSCKDETTKGGYFGLADIDENGDGYADESFFCIGDIVRVTIDGVSNIFTAANYSHNSGLDGFREAYVGNLSLTSYSDSQDSGENYCVISEFLIADGKWHLFVYMTDNAEHQFKIERVVYA